MTAQILNDAFLIEPQPYRRMDQGKSGLSNCLRLIRVEDFAPESKMKIIMRSDLSRAVAF